MWASASRSSRGVTAAVVALLAVAAGNGGAVEQALRRLFPPPLAVTKDTLFLTDEQAAAAEREAEVGLPSRIVTRYLVREAGGESPVGFAYLDTHLVRTLPETLLIVVDANGSVTRVEVLTFAEPPEYEPSRRWFDQFEGHALDEDLRLRRGIRTLSGATLSSEAAANAVRRVLAVHRVACGAGGNP